MKLEQMKIQILQKILEREVRLIDLNLSKLKKKERAVTKSLLDKLSKPTSQDKDGKLLLNLNASAKHIIKKLLGRNKSILENNILPEYDRRKLEGILTNEVYQAKKEKIMLTINILKEIIEA